jgi:hypothetical protein
VGQHCEGKIQCDDFGGWVLIYQNTGKAAFAATGVECKLAVHVAKEAGDHLDVIDAWVDGGREVFFVACGFFKALPDLRQSNGAGGL